MLCLTETQKKIDNIKRSKGIKGLNSMREERDQKGGGLAIMYREREDFKWNKIENGIKDMLEVEGRIGELEVRIFLNYFRTGSREEVNINNNRVKDFIVGRIEELGQNIGIIVLGDFNGPFRILRRSDRK